MGWFRKRFGEASTHAGLSMLALVAASFFPTQAAWIVPLAGVLGGTAVVVPEAAK